MLVEYNYTVFIGRMQPLHRGHQRVIDEALRKSERLIILLGSAQAAMPAKFKQQHFRPLRNPFSWTERFEMIKRTYHDKTVVTAAEYSKYSENFKRDGVHIIVAPLEDHGYNDDAWVSSVQKTVDEITQPAWTDKPPKIALIGRKKDNSSYYLSLFPQWDSIPIQDDGKVLDATDVRTDFIRNGRDSLQPGSMISSSVSTPVRLYLHEFANKYPADLDQLREELQWNERYKAMWKDSPYPVIHQTVDAIVVQSGHILLVRRGAMPGKGLWALPGGYVEPKETLYDASIRELKEETRFGLSEFSLKAAYQGARTFDNPYRSDRGRVITTAHYFRLQDRTTLPAIHGSDDAREAAWVPLSRLEPNQLFEDHGMIIEAMVGI